MFCCREYDSLITSTLSCPAFNLFSSSVRYSIIAQAMLLLSPGLYKYPLIPCLTILGIPPTSVLTIGRPHPIASNIAIGIPSLYEGRRKMSASLKYCLFCSSRIHPGNSTLSLYFALSFCLTFSISPLPPRINRASGILLHTWSTIAGISKHPFLSHIKHRCTRGTNKIK